MNNINMYYETKRLFDTKDEVFRVYYILKERLIKNSTYPILIIYANERVKKQNLFMINSRIQNEEIKTQRIREDEIIMDEKTYIFKTINEISDIRNLAGMRFSEIRFL